MSYSMRKKPLYRKVNTKAKGVRHDFGQRYSDLRGTKKSAAVKIIKTMIKGRHRGLDYTPLFRFLLSKVGEPWEPIYKEAVSRLDKEEPIFWMVSLDRESGSEIIRVGESTYFSGLFVDEQGKLQKIAPELGPESITPNCSCCTQTFNGIVLAKKDQEQQPIP